MRRGEVWVANLNPTRGAEMGKIRPVLIMQAEWLTVHSPETIVIIPMSTQSRRSLEPFRVAISARDRLRRSCQVVPEKIRALDRSKFGPGPVTTLTADEMAAVEKSLKAVLGFL